MTVPPNGPTTGSSEYKTWAITLRAWSKDPTTSLDALPPLTEASFSPKTYQRLLDRLTSSVHDMMKRWHDAFIASWTEALATGNVHLAEKTLVDARRLLLPRLRLSSHPSLPEQFRTALLESMRSDVESLQQQLEEALSKPSGGAAGLGALEDRMLQIVRENSLVHIFDDGYVDGTAIIGIVDRVAAVPSASSAPPAPPVSSAAPAPPAPRRAAPRMLWGIGSQRRN